MKNLEVFNKLSDKKLKKLKKRIITKFKTFD